MNLAFPWLMAVAGGLAFVGIVRLLRPPRRRVAVFQLALWRRAMADVGPRRLLRRPRFWVVLVAAGGLALAGAVGGWARSADRLTPPAVRVLVADSPQLLAVDRQGRTQKAHLLERADAVFAAMPDDTPVRLAVLAADTAVSSFQAGQWAARRNELDALLTGEGPVRDAVEAERGVRRPDERFVFLLGRFEGAPAHRADLQWAFCPAPPGRDAGIVSAGAERVGGDTELFVTVCRFTGPGSQVPVVVEDAGSGAPLAAPSEADLRQTDRVGLSIPLRGDASGPIRIRLAAADDQPANDAFYLAPEPASRVLSVELVGRPNEWIDKAIADSDRLTRRPTGAEPADWLIVNEPADAVRVEPGQAGGVVLIDPLVLPAGVRLAGRLEGAIKIASRLDQPPWRDIPLNGVSVRRAAKVALGGGWAAVAWDGQANPLIAWRAADRLLAVFFSVAPDNSDWFRRAGWPIFWDALADLTGDAATGGEPVGRAGLRWTWRPGTKAGLQPSATPGGPPLATNLPADLFEPADESAVLAVNQADIRRPPARLERSAAAVWPWLAGLGLVLLGCGWLLMALAARADRAEMSSPSG